MLLQERTRNQRKPDNVGNRHTHWCPDGCGKKVVFMNRQIGFFCKKCKKRYTRESLDKFLSR